MPDCPTYFTTQCKPFDPLYSDQIRAKGQLALGLMSSERAFRGVREIELCPELSWDEVLLYDIAMYIDDIADQYSECIDDMFYLTDCDLVQWIDTACPTDRGGITGLWIGDFNPITDNVFAQCDFDDKGGIVARYLIPGENIRFNGDGTVTIDGKLEDYEKHEIKPQQPKEGWLSRMKNLMRFE